jgi:regulator of protease activity HflC (stomatin/prohibitin superfamily)
MSWLVELFDRLLSVIPRIILVKAFECGIKFKRGGRVVELRPGLHLHWPLVSEVTHYPTARTTMNLPMQTLESADGDTYVVSAAIVYRVTNPVKAFTENYEIEDTLTDLAMVAVADYITNNGGEDFLVDTEKKLTELTRKRLNRFGVRVDRASLTDVATCRVIRNVCDVPGD